jgi:hypothetical protein
MDGGTVIGSSALVCLEGATADEALPADTRPGVRFDSADDRRLRPWANNHSSSNRDAVVRHLS